MFKQPDRDGWWTTKKGVFHSLGTNETKARKASYAIHGQDEVVGADMRVADMLFRYLSWSAANHAATTRTRIKKNLESFSKSLPVGLPVTRLLPIHLTEWLDQRCLFQMSERQSLCRVGPASA